MAMLRACLAARSASAALRLALLAGRPLLRAAVLVMPSISKKEVAGYMRKGVDASDSLPESQQAVVACCNSLAVSAESSDGEGGAPTMRSSVSPCDVCNRHA